MTDDELKARFKELEEHAEACATLAVLSAIELTGVFAAMLIQRGVCSPQNINQILDLALEDSKPLQQDSPEATLARKMFAQSIDLLRRRVAEIEMAKDQPALQ